LDITLIYVSTGITKKVLKHEKTRCNLFAFSPTTPKVFQEKNEKNVTLLANSGSLQTFQQFCQTLPSVNNPVALFCAVL